MTDDDRITSTRNRRVVAAAKLSRRREREATGRYLVEGPNAVGEALQAGAVETLFVVDERAPDYEQTGGRTEVVRVAEHVLERLADSRSPQGVVGVARIDQSSLDAVVGRGVLLVLARISDPGNAGTAIRTADAAGAAGVVLTDGSVDPWNPKAVRATAGSLVHLPIVTGVDLEAVTGTCRAAGQRVIGLDAKASGSVFTLEEQAGPVALVFGSEAHGLPDDAGALLDETVAIPLWGAAESLNLAAAVAVTLYSAARAAHRHGTS